MLRFIARSCAPVTSCSVQWRLRLSPVCSWPGAWWCRSRSCEPARRASVAATSANASASRVATKSKRWPTNSTTWLASCKSPMLTWKTRSSSAPTSFLSRSSSRPKGMSFLHVASHGAPDEYNEYMQNRPIEADRGTVAGRVLLEGKPIHIADVQADPEYTMTEISRRAGFHTILGVPLLREGNPIGVLILFRNTVRPFTEKQIELVTTFADQAVIAIENVRLFEEIQEKSRQVEEASKHKSQFLANMSHELRTPLNAILGYTELVFDFIYGAPPEKMRNVLERIQTNGKHLLGLINDVLDLS